MTKLLRGGPNIHIDPRAITCNHYIEGMATFEITYAYHDNGELTVTFMKLDDKEMGCEFFFRVYDSNKEVVPSFTSKIYTYLGIEGEQAPHDTVKGFIGQSVTTIQRNAFRYCRSMKEIQVHDNVEVIEACAFFFCIALTTIKLPRTLKQIESEAFRACVSLDALFLPLGVEKIAGLAFKGCKNMKILSLPPTITAEQIGARILYQCDTFFHITPSVYGYKDPLGGNTPSAKIHQAIIDFHRDLPPFHKACLETDIRPQLIQDHIRICGRSSASTATYGGISPVHILAMNPRVTSGCMMACLDLNLDLLFVKDETGMTPLDYLWKCNNIECIISIMSVLCLHHEVKNDLKS